MPDTNNNKKHQSKSFFVTGIGTDVGKTVVSAIVSEALQAHYWKPIQSGDLEYSDSLKVKNWTKNVTVLPEKYKLNNPLSPHTSARLDGINIASKIELPQVNGTLIIEGAGGILVPINDNGTTICDWLIQLDIPVIVVVKHYLGSINHTLLTLEHLNSKSLKIAGIVVSGERNEESERIIETISGQTVKLHIPFSQKMDASFVREQAEINNETIGLWLRG